MLASNEKISMRQAVMLFYMATLSPAIRLFPQFTAKTAGKAGWLAPFAAIIPVIALVYIINSFFKKSKDGNLSDVFYKVLGNFLGRIIAFLYLLWMLLLLALYVRYYAERILSSILPSTSIYFLIMSMLIMVFIAARIGLVAIARVNEIFFCIFLIIFIATFVLAIPDVTFRNIMYVSYLDAFPVIKASQVIMSIWGFFLYIFFFGDKINDKENIKRFGFQGLFLKFVLSIILLVTVIGTLGATLTSRVSLPFFIVVKNISILGTIERLESILLALWVISDFVIITVFTFISVSLIRSIFRLSESKSMVSPIVLYAGIGALFLANNRFELEKFSISVALPASAVLTFVIPAIIFVIGKIRKKL